MKPTVQADLLKVSNSNDRFRQTVEGDCGNGGGCLDKNLAWKRSLWPSWASHSEGEFRDIDVKNKLRICDECYCKIKFGKSDANFIFGRNRSVG